MLSSTLLPANRRQQLDFGLGDGEAGDSMAQVWMQSAVVGRLLGFRPVGQLSRPLSEL